MSIETSTIHMVVSFNHDQQRSENMSVVMYYMRCTFPKTCRQAFGPWVEATSMHSHAEL